MKDFVVVEMMRRSLAALTFSFLSALVANDLPTHNNKMELVVVIMMNLSF